jgi:hypothetical protein
MAAPKTARALPLAVTILALCTAAPLSAAPAGTTGAAVGADPGRRPDERDAIIDSLLRRVADLERRLGATEAAPPAAAVVSQPTPPATPSPVVPLVPPEDEVATALERSLVQEGGLFVPFGAYEVEPGMQYAYRGDRALTVAAVDGADQLVEQDARDDRFEASVAARAGLPWGLQADARLPYALARSEVAFADGTEERSEAGIGNVELGLSRQFVAERGLVPDLLGFVRWRTPLGDDDVAREDQGVSFGATTVKTQDPLVWVGSAAYTVNAGSRQGGVDIERGDDLVFSAGSLLAVSPETSLGFFANLGLSDEAELDGEEVAGSDQLAAALEVSAATVLTPRALLSAGVAAGVTDDALDLQLRFSLPVRF